MGMQLLEKWEWECNVAIEMGGNENGNDFMGMGGNGNPKTKSAFVEAIGHFRAKY